MPGGVNSPVRAYGAVDLTPPFIQSAKGAKIIDVDDNAYIDYVGSWGAMILGHAQTDVVHAIQQAAELGTSYGAPTENEFKLAHMICTAMPSIEMLRLVNSGTEAAMSAIRLARGFTGRDLILKFEGCYHGHCDGLLVKAGSGALTSGVSDSAGVPIDYAQNTLVAQYNDSKQVEEIFKNSGNRLAAVIVEPVAANMGVVLPDAPFLKTLSKFCNHYGALLIFDEVITGFRVAYGGAQAVYDIEPDITILGKIIGGGLPIGAYGGRREIMQKVSPLGTVYQAGTLSGNPIAVTAGLSTLKVIKNEPDFYKKLDQSGALIEDALKEAGKIYNVNITINRIGSMMSVFFTDKAVTNLQTAKLSDLSKFKTYFEAMHENGIYIAPSPYEALFVSYAHRERIIEKSKAAILKAFCALSED